METKSIYDGRENETQHPWSKHEQGLSTLKSSEEAGDSG